MGSLLVKAGVNRRERGGKKEKEGEDGRKEGKGKRGKIEKKKRPGRKRFRVVTKKTNKEMGKGQKGEAEGRSDGTNQQKRIRQHVKEASTDER